MNHFKAEYINDCTLSTFYHFKNVGVMAASFKCIISDISGSMSHEAAILALYALAGSHYCNSLY